jgi:hypothetical protein
VLLLFKGTVATVVAIFEVIFREGRVKVA